jgi:hypothetical protein
VLEKPHSQEWLCYKNRRLGGFFRSLFSLWIFCRASKIKPHKVEVCVTKLP